jgi:hypothetical protein
MAVSEQRLDLEIENVGLIGWLIYDQFGPAVEVERVDIPAEFHLRFPGESTQPSLHIDYTIRDDQLVCTGIRLDAKPLGREVKPSDVDVVRRMLLTWTTDAVIAVIRDANEVTEAQARSAYRTVSRKATRRTITDRLLADVARLYRDNVDNKPWRVIAKHYNVSEATAARYVMLARRDEFLPPTTSGKKRA